MGSRTGSPFKGLSWKCIDGDPSARVSRSVAGAFAHPSGARMVRFGLICPAATGHLHTMLPLGQELLRRGHAVIPI